METDLKNKKGFALIEVVIAISVLLIVFLSLLTVYNYYIRISINNTPSIKSSYLIEEGIEAVKILRDISWDEKIATLTEGTPYYLQFANGTFQTTETKTFIEGIYERTVVLSPVYRDSEDDIQPTGTLDPDTKKVTARVAWSTGNSTTTKSISTYITNMFQN